MIVLPYRDGWEMMGHDSQKAQKANSNVFITDSYQDYSPEHPHWESANQTP